MRDDVIELLISDDVIDQSTQQSRRRASSRRRCPDHPTMSAGVTVPPVASMWRRPLRRDEVRIDAAHGAPPRCGSPALRQGEIAAILPFAAERSVIDRHANRVARVVGLRLRRLRHGRD